MDWTLVVVVAIAIGLVLVIRKALRAASLRMAQAQKESAEKMEAMFRASFPELQPHFHPARVHEFVKARRARKAGPGLWSWQKPPGFPDAQSAEVEPDGARENVRIVDAAGATLAAFVFEEVAEGGALRLGKGKLTATLNAPEPKVRYWHPDREFKWTPTSWKFQTRMSDNSLDSDNTSSSFSDTSSDTTTNLARGAVVGAATGGLMAAGGDSSPAFGNVRSGSSTSY